MKLPVSEWTYQLNESTGITERIIQKTQIDCVFLSVIFLEWYTLTENQELSWRNFFVVTYVIAYCLNDSIQYHQWRQSCIMTIVGLSATNVVWFAQHGISCWLVNTSAYCMPILAWWVVRKHSRCFYNRHLFDDWWYLMIDLILHRGSGVTTVLQTMEYRPLNLSLTATQCLGYSET